MSIDNFEDFIKYIERELEKVKKRKKFTILSLCMSIGLLLLGLYTNDAFVYIIAAFCILLNMFTMGLNNYLINEYTEIIDSTKSTDNQQRRIDKLYGRDR